MIYSFTTSNQGIQYYEPITKLNKFAPVYLTTSDAITSYGLYSKFIPSGNYICKILDYYENCLPYENTICSDTYRYIGHIYDGIYPYTSEVLQKLLPTSGGRKKVRRRKTKRKTRMSRRSRK
jgi:hypothetical protein